MRNWKQWPFAIIFISMGGVIFGAGGLALAGLITGWLVNSSQRGFLMSGLTAAFFWLIIAVVKIAGDQSPQLLALAGSLANLSGAKTWLLLMVSSIIAFCAGGLGGWLGGSLRQLSKTSSN